MFTCSVAPATTCVSIFAHSCSVGRTGAASYVFDPADVAGDPVYGRVRLPRLSTTRRLLENSEIQSTALVSREY